MQCECVDRLLLLVGVAASAAFPFIIGPSVLIALAFHFRAGARNPSPSAPQKTDDQNYDGTLAWCFLRYSKRS